MGNRGAVVASTLACRPAACSILAILWANSLIRMHVRGPTFLITLYARDELLDLDAAQPPVVLQH